MNRRDFTKNSGLGLLGLLLAPALQSCRKSYDPNPNPVLIIGAGMAGLAAAHKLKEYGFTNITIIEGRNRYGGRIFTDRSLGQAADLGASWIHGPSRKNPIRKLADEVGARTFRTDDDSVQVYYNNGQAVNDDSLSSKEEAFDQLQTSAKSRSSDSKSLFQAMNEEQNNFLNDPLMQFFSSAYTEFDVGAPIEQISSSQWDQDSLFDGADVVLPDGYDQLINRLAQGLDIRLNQTVTSVDYSGSEVQVRCAGGTTFSGKHLICTLPLGVLKSNQVQFSPSLPSNKTDAMGRLGMGLVNKVLLLFPSVFWDNSLQYIGYCSNTKGQFPYFLNVRKFSPINALMGFALGNYAVDMETKTNQQIQQEIMSILRTMYGNAIPDPTNVLISRWAADPFAAGAYSFAAVGSRYEDFEQMAAAVDGKLFFAGEHTEADYRGTVHGAFLSGEREAEKILDLY